MKVEKDLDSFFKEEIIDEEKFKHSFQQKLLVEILITN